MTRSASRLASLLALALMVGFGKGAHAQTTGLALDRFSPSERGSDWFEEDSLDFRGHLRPAVGIVGDYADRPLVIVNANGSENSAPVHDQLILHFGGSLTLWNRLRAGVDLPIAVYEDGTTGFVGKTEYPATSSDGFGDVRLSLDSRIVGSYGEPFSLAGGVAVFVPSGSQASYMGDGSIRALLRVAAAGDVSWFSYGAHVGFEIRPEDNDLPGYATGSEVQVGVSGGVRALNGALLVGPELYGATVVTSSSAFFSARQTPFEGLVGVHYALAGGVRLGGGIGTGLSHGFGEPSFRGVLGVEWAPAHAPAPPDRDHDGVPDDKDACPDTPGVATDDPKTNGCPLADRDHDGIADDVDACSDVPGIKTDDPRTNGCPSDRDHDGIPDKEDACPDVPGVAMSDPKLNGCPPDSDHDGIPDAEDACPDVPGIKTNDPKTNGCPEGDRDNDGVPNSEDACPDAPGPRDADPKRSGCPEAFIQDDLIHVLDRVSFVPKTATLAADPETKRALEAVAALLAAHPDVKRVRIEGHTDNQGDAAQNRALAEKRATSVLVWLKAHGVAAGRLGVMGVGGDSPIADNTTEAGRRQNERIEIHVEP
jgi:OmpA-OmpF porin, OOP family